MGKLLLVRIDSQYCDYLRKFDYRVPFNKDKKELRPFVGVLFEINDVKYFAPLTSPKTKHKKMKNTIDFLKIDSGNLGAINFNNMIPVTNRNIIEIDLNKKSNKLDEKKYYKLLSEQLYWLNRNIEKLYDKSKKIYDKYINGNLNFNIANRCCNYKLLEEKCKEYNS